MAWWARKMTRNQQYISLVICRAKLVLNQMITAEKTFCDLSRERSVLKTRLTDIDMSVICDTFRNS